ncbi:cytohesin-interacting protein [Anolis carolinensis]|uniref:cytohesin-interacting protein n=1 Tax=Anolis carolinensis TaxID=28377 RepID=UPI002F2B247C
MSLKRLIQQNRKASCGRYGVSSAYSPGLETIDSPKLNNKSTEIFPKSVETLSRDLKQLALSRTTSLGDFSGPQRKSLKIFKEDNETFGFEIQILPFQWHSNHLLETCVYVCKVKEGSRASLSGLQNGYILMTINGVSTLGLSLKQMVDMFKLSRNLLRLDVVNEALIIKQMELETKLQLLKKTLQEKVIEFQSLCLQEQRLANGEEYSPVDSACLEESNLLVDCIGLESIWANKPRYSSESSCLSRLSSMTVDSEDSFYQTCVFEDTSSERCSRQSSMEDDCFLPRDIDVIPGKTSLRRSRSISVSSNGPGSPLPQDRGSTSSVFGTLPRKNRKGSVRKRLLNFIPGLYRAVEEEESRV